MIWVEQFLSRFQNPDHAPARFLRSLRWASWGEIKVFLVNHQVNAHEPEMKSPGDAASAMNLSEPAN